MLKRYTSIREIARDIRDIKRKCRPVASDLIETLAADDHDLTVIKFGGKNAVNKTNTLTREEARSLTKKTAELNTLTTHQREINNILNTLQNEFNDGDYPEKDKLTLLAKKLAASITEKTDRLRVSLSIDAKDSLPDTLGQVANILKRSLDKKMKPISKSQKVQSLTALVKEKPQHTIYFIYTDVEDEKNEVTPSYVIALTNYDNVISINPSLHEAAIPGKFNVGMALKNAKPNDMANEALKLIDHQLAADSMLSAITGIPVPFSKTKLNQLKAGANIKMSFNPSGDALLVSVSQKMTEAQMRELAEKITVQINSLILRDKTLPKMTIRYTPRKKAAPGFGWEIAYKFLPAGKYTGKTLNQEDVSHLRQRFDDDEIRTILLALQK
jgi:hypothetical protein